MALCRGRTVCLASAERRVARGGLAAGSPLAPDPPDPQHDAEQAALRESISRAVMDLPERERDVVVLRMLRQRSTRETAEMLGCAEGTVKATLHHALKKLQISMEVWVS
jgi:RNA polymerase sigma factor (sigma-70 family)